MANPEDNIAQPQDDGIDEDEIVNPIDEASNIYEKIDAIFHGDCVECARGRAYTFLGMAIMATISTIQFSVIIYLLWQQR